ncbi:hypothetical protein HDV01_006642 [Terramyces sp. JEL0728]|nr:hypothetical protein HDV01_006642 [Terramyces sp. JEL0728]
MNPNQRPHSRQPSQNNPGQFADLLGDFTFPKSNGNSPNGKTLSQLAQPGTPKQTNYPATKPNQPINSGISSPAIKPSQFVTVGSVNSNSNSPKVPNSANIQPIAQTPPTNNLQFNNFQSPMKPTPTSQINLANMQNQMLMNMESSLSKSNTVQKPNKVQSPDLNTLMKSQTVVNPPFKNTTTANNPMPAKMNTNASLNQAATLNQFGKPIINNAPTIPASSNSQNEWQGFDIFGENTSVPKPTSNVQTTAPSKQLDVFDLEFLGKGAESNTGNQGGFDTKENPLGILALPIDSSPKKPTVEPEVVPEKNPDLSPVDTLESQLIKMGFSAKESKLALKNTNNDLERAIELLCNPAPSEPSNSDYAADDIARLQSMGFKAEQSRIAMVEANGDVEKAIDILVHQKFTRKVSFSAETPNRAESKADTAKIVDTASLIGKTMFNGAKSVLAFSKKKVEAVLDNIAKEKEERGYYDKSDDELEWAKSKYKDNAATKSSEQSEPVQKLSKQSPVHMPGFEEEDEADIPLEKKRSSSTQKAAANPQPDLFSPSFTIPVAKRAQIPVSNNQSDISSSPYAKPAPPQNQIKEVAATRMQLDSSNSHKQLGNELFKKGQFGDAEQEYAAAINELPEGHSLTFTLFNNRAAARLKTGDYRGAISDCNLVYNRDPQDVKCLLRRANAWEALEQWEKAKDDYKKIMAIDSNTKGVSLAIARCTSAAAPQEQTKQVPKPA